MGPRFRRVGHLQQETRHLVLLLDPPMIILPCTKCKALSGFRGPLAGACPQGVVRPLVHRKTGGGSILQMEIGNTLGSLGPPASGGVPPHSLGPPARAHSGPPNEMSPRRIIGGFSSQRPGARSAPWVHAAALDSAVDSSGSTGQTLKVYGCGDSLKSQNAPVY